MKILHTTTIETEYDVELFNQDRSYRFMSSTTNIHNAMSDPGFENILFTEGLPAVKESAELVVKNISTAFGGIMNYCHQEGIYDSAALYRLILAKLEEEFLSATAIVDTAFGEPIYKKK